MILYLGVQAEPAKISLFNTAGQIIRTQEFEMARNQTEELLSRIDALIEGKKEEIEGIFINTSGSSYTSKRVGLTVVNILGLALNIQPVEVSAETELNFFTQKKPFTAPILPVYVSAPNITPKKNGL